MIQLDFHEHKSQPLVFREQQNQNHLLKIMFYELKPFDKKGGMKDAAL